MTKCCKNCKFAKVNWAAAYKQIIVNESDHHLQYFEWLGRYFLELCLVFEGMSSVGIYDRFAKIVLFILFQRIAPSVRSWPFEFKQGNQ